MSFVVGPDCREQLADDLARREGGEFVGADGDRQAVFTFVHHDPGWLVMVEPLGGRDRFWLSDPSLGDAPVRAVCCVEVFHYPRMFLVAEGMVRRAAEHFFATGGCSPEQAWVDEEQVLARYDVLADPGAG